MADERNAEGSRRRTMWLTTVAAVLGLIVSVAALNVDRTLRFVAIAIGVLGFAVVLIAPRLRRAKDLVLGVGIALVLLAGLVLVVSPTPTPPQPPEASAELSLSQVLITGGTDGKPVALDITVHNLGSRLAVLTGVRLYVRDFAYLPACYTAGAIGASKPYPVTLPDNPPRDSVATLPLHEEVGPDNVDRFVVVLRPPPFRGQDEGRPEMATFGYRVSAALTSDVQNSLSLGSAVFTVPWIPFSTDLWDVTSPRRRSQYARSVGLEPVDWTDPEWRRVETCLDSNSRTLARLLDQPGVRTDELDGVLEKLRTE